MGAASVVAAVGFCGAGFHALVSNCLAARGCPLGLLLGCTRPPERERGAFTCCACAMMAAIAADGMHRQQVSRGTYWRTKIMRRARLVQVLLLWTCVPFLAGWAGAQSNPHGATSSGNAASSERTEQQEMRDELKALRAEVERLRAEVEQHRPGSAADDRGVLMPATTGGPIFHR